jgi:hypothetical protein
MRWPAMRATSGYGAQMSRAWPPGTEMIAELFGGQSALILLLGVAPGASLAAVWRGVKGRVLGRGGGGVNRCPDAGCPTSTTTTVHRVSGSATRQSGSSRPGCAKPWPCSVVCDLTQQRAHGRRVGWCYRRERQIARHRHLRRPIAPAAEPGAVPRQPRGDQGLGDVLAATEPPSLDYQELAVLGLIEIEDASEPDKPQWMAMLTPAGQLRAHRIAVALLGNRRTITKATPASGSDLVLPVGLRLVVLEVHAERPARRSPSRRPSRRGWCARARPCRSRHPSRRCLPGSMTSGWYTLGT